MRFTEHELTVAVTAAAKVVAGGKVRRRAKDDDAWEAMSKIDRYHLLEAVGSQVLPVLLGAEVAARQREHERVTALQLAERPDGAGVVGQGVVREDAAGDDVGTHGATASRRVSDSG